MKKGFWYYQHVYKTFKQQQNKSKDSDLKFYNFWDEKSLQDYWLYRFINHHKLNPTKKEVTLLSVFGFEEMIYLTKRPRIFYTGENVYLLQKSYQKYYGNKVDLALGFDDIEKKNYLRLPFWILRIVSPESDFKELEKTIALYNDSANRLNPDRTRFACNISRHDNNGLRRDIITDLNKISNVDCAGKFLNNTQELFEKYNDNKSLFLRNYKFNICPENSNAKGYVTEKPFESIRSGCIPIYWGSDNYPEPEILNHDAIIFYNKDGDNSAALEKIERIQNSDEEFKKFAEIRPFQDNAAVLIWETIEQLKDNIQKVINK